MRRPARALAAGSAGIRRCGFLTSRTLRNSGSMPTARASPPICATVKVKADARVAVRVWSFCAPGSGFAAEIAGAFRALPRAAGVECRDRRQELQSDPGRNRRRGGADDRCPGGCRGPCASGGGRGADLPAGECQVHRHGGTAGASFHRPAPRTSTPTGARVRPGAGRPCLWLSATGQALAATAWHRRRRGTCGSAAAGLTAAGCASACRSSGVRTARRPAPVLPTRTTGRRWRRWPARSRRGPG